MPDATGQSAAARPAPPTSPAPTSPAHAAKLPSTRIVSIDALRGLTMLAMVLVNNPGTWAAIYPPLRHADWHGCTPTDLIFPFFLFIVGAAMAQSMLGPRPAQPAPPSPWPRIWKRAALLVALGVALNAAGPALELLLRGDGSGFATLRLPGVLQRIGLCYLLACAVVLWLPVAWQAVVAAVMLLASWAVMAWVPPPEVLPVSAAHAAAGVLGEGTLSNVGSLGRWLDLQIFGAAHLYSGSPTDPEGLLGTVPATVTVLMGVWAGLWQRRARAVGRAGAAGGVGGGGGGGGGGRRGLAAGRRGVRAGGPGLVARAAGQQGALDSELHALRRRMGPGGAGGLRVAVRCRCSARPGQGGGGSLARGRTPAGDRRRERHPPLRRQRGGGPRPDGGEVDAGR